jgi:hypothetical protein
MAVTQRKEEEQLSSSVFNTALVGTPISDFSYFITPNESIRHQDLVLWITSGLMHYPGSEDAPVTPTTGSTMGFVLRPSNFHDVNAAVDLADVVYVPGKVDNATAKAIAGENATAESISVLDIALAHQPFFRESAKGEGGGEQCMPSYSGAVRFIPGYDPTEKTLDLLEELAYGPGGAPTPDGTAVSAGAAAAAPAPAATTVSAATARPTSAAAAPPAG